jgi:hypothetical protein
MHVEPNGTGFADANAYGRSPIGEAGMGFEPVEPATETNTGSAAHKSLISAAPDWRVSVWFNRRTLNNTDTLMYIGASNGFGGGGPETAVYSDRFGAVGAQNWSDASTADLDMLGGSVAPGTWHRRRWCGAAPP